MRGPRDTLPALQCLGGLILAGVWSVLWGPLLVWRTEFSGTRSDSRLCGGITNGEIKGMLHSHSGKMKCARTSLFRSELELVLQGCTPSWISSAWPSLLPWWVVLGEA